MLQLRTCALALAACQMTSAFPTINVKGSKFFTSDGDQFFIKGGLLIFWSMQSVKGSRGCLPSSERHELAHE